MTIQFVKQTHEREGSEQAERKGALLEITNRRYLRTFDVGTNDINDGPDVIRRAVLYGIPQIGDGYFPGNDNDTLATCTNVEVKATNSPYVWKVTAHYDTDRLVSATLNNPLLVPPEIAWSGSEYERPMIRDARGVSVTNSSREAFDPPLMSPERRPVLTITRNELSYNPVTQVLYSEVCNLNTFAGAAPYCAKINHISSVRQIDIGLIYYKTTYEIEFRQDSFAYFVLDQGFRDANKKLFLDPLTGAPLSNPTLLNGRGAARTAGVTTLQAACGLQDMTISVVSADASALFPTLGSLGFNGALPPNWFFEIKIDNEVMQVRDNPSPGVWAVLRGYAGTTPAAHSNGASVSLEPYFLRYLPARQLDFGPLNLPVI